MSDITIIGMIVGLSVLTWGLLMLSDWLLGGES
jgi:hypothetical protein